MFKLAFYEFWADNKSYYRKHKGTVVLYLILFAIIGGNIILSDGVGEISFWLIYLAFLTVSGADYDMEHHYPAIFSYAPLNVQEKKHYLLIRVFMNGAMLMVVVLLFSILYIIGGVHYWLAWLGVWTILVLCRQKILFYKNYKQVNCSLYYPNMTVVEKFIYWLTRIMDILTFVYIFIYLGHLDKMHEKVQLNMVQLNQVKGNPGAYIAMGCLVYQCFSLVYFVIHVRIAMKRLKLPELVEA